MNLCDINKSNDTHFDRVIRNIFAMMLCVSILITCMSKSTSADHANSEVFKIGWMDNMFDHTNLVDIQAGIMYWVEELAGNKGHTAKGIMYDNIDTIIDDLQSQRVDMVHSRSIDYLKIAQHVDTELAYVRSENGKKVQKYLLLVHSDDPITELYHLQGKTLSVKSSYEIEMLFLNSLLLSNTLQESDGFFTSFIEKDRSTRVVLSVFFKEAEACVVAEEVFNMMVELNPQIGKDLKILTASPEIVNEVAFFRKNLNRHSKDEVIEVMTHLGDLPKGDYVLTLFRTEGLVPVDDSDLDTLRSMMKMYDKLKTNNNKNIIRNVKK